VVGLVFAAGITLYGAVQLIAGLVALGHGSGGSAWGETIAGAIFLVPVPLVILLTVWGARRRRRRAVRAVLGEEER